MTADIDILQADRTGRGMSTRDLLHEVREGRLVRVSHGRYVAAAEWERLGDLERHRVRTMAVASTAATDNVYSHHAAAALWRIPIIGDWPAKIEVVGERGTGGRSSEQIRRRAIVPDADVGSVQGLRVTTPAQTAADLARVLPRIEAIAVIDSACWRGRTGPRAELDDVRRIVGRDVDEPGSRRAVDAVLHATDLAESVWETVSRLAIVDLGFPDPVLQHAFRWSGKESYRVDFWWPDHGVIGEFDGLVKYASTDVADGRDTLIREKVREDRLRSLSSGFVRWTASDVREPRRLARLLTSAGLPHKPASIAHAKYIGG